MSQRDDDIEFDFFEDEPETGQAQSGSAGTPRAGGRMPRRPAGPPRGSGPILRLAALVAGVIVVLLLFVWIVESITGTSQKQVYSNYMSSVSKIAAQSKANGAAVIKALNTPGVKQAGIVATLHSIADSERQNVKAAQSLNPPGPLRSENTNLIEALQLRVSGIDGLAKTFRTASKSPNAAKVLAAQANRLVASDVVWDDLFLAPTKGLLVTKGITGVNVPESQSVTDPNFPTVLSMGYVVTRISGASTGGSCTGKHGTNIASVVAQPSGKTLVAGATQLNTVTATTSLSFQVTVEDSGDGEEVGIPVTLSINTTPRPISKTQTISSINPGSQVTVTFTDFSDPALFEGTKKLIVDVKRVPCEVVISNNTATYNVLFSIAG
jgi:CARDB